MITVRNDIAEANQLMPRVVGNNVECICVELPDTSKVLTDFLQPHQNGILSHRLSQETLLQADSTARYAQARAESVENKAEEISFNWKCDKCRHDIWRKSRINIRHHIDRASTLAGKLIGQVHLLKKSDWTIKSHE